jgi:hypothetical protein
LCCIDVNHCWYVGKALRKTTIKAEAFATLAQNGGKGLAFTGGLGIAESSIYRYFKPLLLLRYLALLS